MTKPIELILSRIEGLKRSGDSGHQWVGCCPAHEDAHQSLMVGVGHNDVVLIDCRAGCSWREILASVGLGPRDLYPEDGEVPVVIKPSVGLLACEKRLPESFLLENVKLTNEPYGVGIRYGKLDGSFLYTKQRTNLVARLGSKVPPGESIAMYGLWKVAKWREEGLDRLYLVEGESDCWVMWHHDLPALGVPGAAGCSALEPEHLEGFGEIILWREPGQSGDAFMKSFNKRLPDLNYKGTIRVITGCPCKDPADLHKRDPESFKSELCSLASKATLHERPDEDVAKKKSRKTPAVPIPDCLSAEEFQRAFFEAGPTSTPGYFPLTDLGNVQRMAFRHARFLRYVTDWGKWLSWNGVCWSINAEDHAYQRAVETVRSIYMEGASEPSMDKKQVILSHAVRSESARSVLAMLKLCRHERAITTTFRQLNRSHWTLNCPNGTIDLKDGSLRQHNREDLNTKVCRTNYNPDAKCEEWEKFLSSTFAGQQSVIDYIRKLMGYCLTGDVSTHILPVFWGCGGNGKGTLLNTILHVMGDDYSGVVASDLIMKKNRSDHPTGLTDLYGKRLAVSQETDDGCRLNEALVKSLTGADPITARRMREDFWQFLPTHKLILSTNYRPVVRGTDRGIWRRLRLIPFTVTFSGASEDSGLPDRLKDESEGILAWMVRGCVEWQRDGEQTPLVVRAATSEYQMEEDLIFRWVDERCLTGPVVKANKCRLAMMHADYSDWVTRCHEGYPVSVNKFSRRLAELGYDKVKDSEIFFRGMAIRGTEAARVAQQSLFTPTTEVEKFLSSIEE